MDYQQIRIMIESNPNAFDMVRPDEADVHGLACDIEDGFEPRFLEIAQKLHDTLNQAKA